MSPTVTASLTPAQSIAGETSSLLHPDVRNEWPTTLSAQSISQKKVSPQRCVRPSGNISRCTDVRCTDVASKTSLPLPSNQRDGKKTRTIGHARPPPRPEAGPPLQCLAGAIYRYGKKRRTGARRLRRARGTACRGRGVYMYRVSESSRSTCADPHGTSSPQEYSGDVP